jgi:hypothetical protein
VREGDYLEDPGVDSRIIFKRFFNKEVGESWTEDRDVSRAGACE